MMRAEDVRHEMNRCGKWRVPFLFGVDFEIEDGFFVENPLENQGPVFFAMEGLTNYSAKPLYDVPHLEVFPIAEECYDESFAIVRNGLARGDSFLLNLTARTPIRTNLSLEQIFCYSDSLYKVWMPGRFVCFSPESFVRIAGNEICSYPMKGTIDATLPDAEERLLKNYKELCEHYTIVDLIRNDLNKIAQKVNVKRFRYVERVKTLRGEILQSSSEVCGILCDDWRRSVGDLIFELLPAGSISGAPKKATVQLIRQAEAKPRGYYTGVFGYFDGRTLDSAVMIRFIEESAGQMYFRSGGGITINSIAEEEYQEVMAKIYLPVL